VAVEVPTIILEAAAAASSFQMAVVEVLLVAGVQMREAVQRNALVAVDHSYCSSLMVAVE
jgi:hypothetical protein